ncbi:ROK family transcriptional regulator [Rhizobium sp. FY34]|uniref:ROK family transcriptional regulator n=1 Tax=Rhizobium sp. FY34 TaxID=2562309 RepID=UPI0010C0A978|nr:ROK family transcriptional regulator [Rhizobium sp. FY34]
MPSVVSFQSSSALQGLAGGAKPGTEQLRRQNLITVLSALRRSGAMSHTGLSVETGLASATVTAVTADLERAGAIERQEQAVSGGRGRPRVMLSPRRSFAHVAAVQISSDAVHYALADYRGTLIDRFSTRRDLEGTPASLLDEVSGAVKRLMERSRLKPEDVSALSLSSKGIVDAEAGRLVWSPVFGDRPVDFAKLLDDLPQAQLALNNETLLVAHAKASRQMQDADAPDFSGLITLSLGHSIGLGIARLDGQGSLAVTAPNFGHMLNAVDDRLCRCGSRGCIEATAGFYGILRLAFQVPPNTIPARFVPLAEMEKIALSARQGTRMAQYAFRQAGLALGQGLSRVLSLYENMPVAITGPGTRFYDLLAGGMEEGLRQSLHVRLNGLPHIDIEPDEAGLVFDGHVDRALAAVDQRVMAVR